MPEQMSKPTTTEPTLRATTEAVKPKPRRKFSRTAVLILVVVVLAGAVGFLAWQNYRLRQPGAQQEIVKQANEALVKEVAQHLLLPDETPNIASIVDIESLRKANAEFYKDAANGDRLLIYSTKAIIYREDDARVINVAPVKLTPQSTTSSTKRQ